MKIIKFIFFSVLFFVMLMAFLPKENIYYFFENKLFEKGISLNEESTKEGLFGLDLSGIDVLYLGDSVARIGQIDAFFGILYNKVALASANPSKNLQNFVPQVERINALYTPFYPTKVFLKGEGGFGSISGSYSIFSKKISLTLNPASDFARRYPMLNSNFKNVDGRLVYELSFK
ncbi:MAG: hypothetical protein LBQ18_05305 [Campylobacteraceae bacterium]|jgi:hypothetical protein|nr:hypothetical protein [Campylobacteraceae bacterium]